MRAGVGDAKQAPEPEGAAGKADTANAKPDGGKETLAADEQPQGKGADQTDDLLFPTEEELRAIKAHDKDAEKAAQPEGAASKATPMRQPTRRQIRAPRRLGKQALRP